MQCPRCLQYAQPVTKKGGKKDAAPEGEEEKKQSNHVVRKFEERKKGELSRLKDMAIRPDAVAMAGLCRCEDRRTLGDSIRRWSVVRCNQQPAWPVWSRGRLHP